MRDVARLKKQKTKNKKQKKKKRKERKKRSILESLSTNCLGTFFE